jgi:chromosome segregation ATPase
VVAAPVSGGVAAVEEVLARESAPTPDTRGDAGGASISIPSPALEEMEVVFGRHVRSGAEQEAAPVPLPRMLSRVHQVLSDTGEAILQKWEVLEAEHQRLSDWRTQLEERTKSASRQFLSERSQLERDGKEYKRDLQKVCARELEASWREKKVTRREEDVSQREALTTEYQAKLNALDQTLEAQRAHQVKAVERLQKWERELEGKASDAALAEENLKAKEQSLDRSETDLARRETNLIFREEMLTRWGELLAEHELEAEEKERKLEEQICQFHATQATPGPQAMEATRKAVKDLQVEHHARVQRITTWAGEASTTLVPLGMSPIPVLELPTSISDALPVLDSVADRLWRLD